MKKEAKNIFSKVMEELNLRESDINTQLKSLMKDGNEKKESILRTADLKRKRSLSFSSSSSSVSSSSSDTFL